MERVLMNERTIEDRLIDALQPVRSYVLASCIHHLFATGLHDSLSESVISARDLATRHELDPVRLDTFLKYLRNEGILVESAGGFTLSERGRELGDFRGWYTMLIGGYGNTFLQVGDRLRTGTGSATRDAAQVGVGSCAISHYDAIPLTRALMRKIPGSCQRLLDLGCGNALYLVEFCKASPEITAWGVEPSPDGYAAAVELVDSAGLGDRIRLTCSTATDFFRTDIDFEPDFIVLGFVLHEILGQEGVEGVTEFLTRIFDRYPDVHLIVIEVDWRMDDPMLLEHGLAMAYYNPYYLLHPFTNQRLETKAFWEDLFGQCGLKILARETVDPRVDSTELEIGYLLARAGAPRGR